MLWLLVRSLVQTWEYVCVLNKRLLPITLELNQADVISCNSDRQNFVVNSLDFSVNVDSDAYLLSWNI